MADDYWIKFGGRVRSARTAAHATQTGFAHAAGLSRSSVANIEAGRQHVTAATVVAFARLLRCDPLWLLNGQQPLGWPQPPPPSVTPAALRQAAANLERVWEHLRELAEMTDGHSLQEGGNQR